MKAIIMTQWVAVSSASEKPLQRHSYRLSCVHVCDCDAVPIVKLRVVKSTLRAHISQINEFVAIGPRI